MVDIHQPPPRSPVKPTIFTLPSGRYIVRVFDPSRHNTTELSFRSFGPLARFDHHRNDPLAPKPSSDRSRSIYYAAFTLSCCVVEVFGDQRTIEVGSYCAASVKLVRDLKLLDLRGSAAMLNGTVVGLSSIPDRALTQEWSRYFYDSPDIYTYVDGIIYPNAHNGEESLALYERAKDGLYCSSRDVMPLSHKLLRADIRRIAQENGLVVAEY